MASPRASRTESMVIAVEDLLEEAGDDHASGFLSS